MMAELSTTYNSTTEMSTSAQLSNENNTGIARNFSIPDGCIVLEVQAMEFIPWDNPDNLMTEEAERVFDLVVVCCLYVLFLVSVPTNLISMAAFYRQGIRERINLCLFSQSLADLLYMLFSFSLYSDRLYLEIAKGLRRGAVSEFIVKNHLLGFYGVAWWSFFITTMIASERCLCVVSPFRSQRILKLRTTAVILVTSFFVIVGFYFVEAGKWGLRCVYNPLTRSASVMIWQTQFYLNNREIMDFLGLFYDLIIRAVFVAVVIVCTAVTVMILVRTQSWRKTSSSAISAKEIALTRMLVGTSILFIVCNIPNIVSRMIQMAVPDFSLRGRYYNTFNFTTNLAELCSYINSSVNFFVYYTMGSKYRETVKSMFGLSRVPDKIPESKTTHTEMDLQSQN